MSELTLTKRKYVRADPSTWSEIEALWEAGDVTLQDLEGRFGISRRALQSRFSKKGITKGAKGAQVVAAVKAKVFADVLPGVEETTARAKATREAAYRNAVIVEDLIMAQLSAAQQDPTQTLRAASAIKALSLAAAGLERIHELKWRALGLDKDSALSDDLPVLVFEDLSKSEIQAIQDQDQESDADFLCPAIAPNVPEDDDVVCEGDEESIEIPSAAPTGPRLVRGAS